MLHEQGQFGQDFRATKSRRWRSYHRGIQVYEGLVNQAGRRELAGRLAWTQLNWAMPPQKSESATRPSRWPNRPRRFWRLKSRGLGERTGNVCWTGQERITWPTCSSDSGRGSFRRTARSDVAQTCVRRRIPNWPAFPATGGQGPGIGSPMRSPSSGATLAVLACVWPERVAAPRNRPAPGACLT